MKTSNVLVTGGAGFIGSHVNMQLNLAGYSTIVLDNLSHGHQKCILQGHFIQGDFGDYQLLKKIFHDFNIDAVMHFAAFINVGESLVHPLKYYENNVINTLQLLKAMVESRVKKIIFSSSAAIFGLPNEIPVKETQPTQPINPYGKTKLMVENILQDFDKAYDMKSCCLRYFNAAGGDPEGKIKNYSIQDENNLIPIALKKLLQTNPSITLFGTDYPTKDGTCVRDYIHVLDLASAHIMAMKQLLEGRPSSQYNLGNGQGFTVREVLETLQKVTGKPLNIIEGKRRPGDPAILIADSQKARRELGWVPHYPDLKTMIQHAWQALYTVGCSTIKEKSK